MYMYFNWMNLGHALARKTTTVTVEKEITDTMPPLQQRTSRKVCESLHILYFIHLDLHSSPYWSIRSLHHRIVMCRTEQFFALCSRTLRLSYPNHLDILFTSESEIKQCTQLGDNTAWQRREAPETMPRPSVAYDVAQNGFFTLPRKRRNKGF